MSASEDELMISSDVLNEKYRVSWPPQPRRPLRPPMKGNNDQSHSPQQNNGNTVEGGERAVQSGTELKLHRDQSPSDSLFSEDESTDETKSDSEFKDGNDEDCVVSKRNSVSQSKFSKLPLYGSPESSSRSLLGSPEGSSRSLLGSPEGSSRSRKSGLCETEASVQRSKNSNLLIILGGLCIGIILICVIGFKSDQEDDISHLPKLQTNRLDTRVETLLSDDIEAIKKRYPSQKNEIWKKFSTGIKRVMWNDISPQPSSFMFLHTSDASDTLRCLTKDIATVAASFLNASGPVVVDGEELKDEHLKNLKFSMQAEDNGWLIERYRPLVEHSRTMIIHNLEKVPATLAQAFHSFCDEVSPLVDKAVYLFTLRMPNCISGRPSQVAHDFLNSLWSDELSDDIRAALLARVIGMPVFVVPENDLPHTCP